MTKVWNEIDEIPNQKLSSDLPDRITATVLSATKSEKKGLYAGAPVLKLELVTSDGETFSTTYRIPKAWTGKGQLDKLMECLSKLKLKPADIVDHTFEWQRMELEGAMQGNPRYYPVKLIGPKKAVDK